MYCTNTMLMGGKLCTFEPAAAGQHSLAVCVQRAVCASPALHGIPPQANAITPGLALTNCMFYLPQGKAGMSVSNALGSNVFNVLIGLGLPYFIVQAARGRPAAVRLPSHPSQQIFGLRCLWVWELLLYRAATGRRAVHDLPRILLAA